MLEELMRMEHIPPATKPDRYDINKVKQYITPNEEGAKLFNKIFDWVAAQGIHKIVRTPSGGICVDKRKGARFPAFDVKATAAEIQMTIILAEGMWAISFRKKPVSSEKDDRIIYPNQAFAKFKAKCAEFGIDLDSYKIDNGPEVKKTIESPLIKLERERVADRTWTNVHHIDFHSSFLGGLKWTHPEFAPVVDFFYEGRKKDPLNKSVLNFTQGMMQSTKNGHNAEWAHLVRDMIGNNNDRVRQVAQDLRDSGRIVLSYNTDGIWYAGDVFHGVGEGTVAGTWGNDHTNCTFRARSAGAYEYIENEQYHVVLRGACKLDRIKPRSEWVWGDIYKPEADVEIFEWHDDIGITYYKGGKVE